MSEEKKLCTYCKKEPVIVTQNVEHTVFRAMQCSCKTTPYKNCSAPLVVDIWEKTTFSQSPDEAFQIAMQENPKAIEIYRPVLEHAL